MNTACVHIGINWVVSETNFEKKMFSLCLIMMLCTHVFRKENLLFLPHENAETKVTDFGGRTTMQKAEESWLWNAPSCNSLLTRFPLATCIAGNNKFFCRMWCIPFSSDQWIVTRRTCMSLAKSHTPAHSLNNSTGQMNNMGSSHSFPFAWCLLSQHVEFAAAQTTQEVSPNRSWPQSRFENLKLPSCHHRRRIIHRTNDKNPPSTTSMSTGFMCRRTSLRSTTVLCQGFVPLWLQAERLKEPISGVPKKKWRRRGSRRTTLWLHRSFQHPSQVSILPRVRVSRSSPHLVPLRTKSCWVKR